MRQPKASKHQVPTLKKKAGFGAAKPQAGRRNAPLGGKPRQTNGSHANHYASALLLSFSLFRSISVHFDNVFQANRF